MTSSFLFHTNVEEQIYYNDTAYYINMYTLYIHSVLWCKQTQTWVCCVALWLSSSLLWSTSMSVVTRIILWLITKTLRIYFLLDYMLVTYISVYCITVNIYASIAIQCTSSALDLGWILNYCNVLALSVEQPFQQEYPDFMFHALVAELVM